MKKKRYTITKYEQKHLKKHAKKYTNMKCTCMKHKNAGAGSKFHSLK